MGRYIEANLSPAARVYFGGDVQAYWLEREPGPSPVAYHLYQRPHRLPIRIAATVVACSARGARKMFEEMIEEALEVKG